MCTSAEFVSFRALVKKGEEVFHLSFLFFSLNKLSLRFDECFLTTFPIILVYNQRNFVLVCNWVLYFNDPLPYS